jgi:hypothetical protein
LRAIIGQAELVLKKLGASESQDLVTQLEIICRILAQLIHDAQPVNTISVSLLVFEDLKHLRTLNDRFKESLSFIEISLIRSRRNHSAST